MKNFKMVYCCLLMLPLSALANLTYDYTATAYSGYKWGQATETLSDTQHNAAANTFNSAVPYRGGSHVGNSSMDSFAVAGFFYPRANQNDSIWGWAEVYGTITINSSADNLMLNIQYEAACLPDQSAAYHTYANYGLVIGQNDFYDILIDYSSFGTETFSLAVESGDQVDFYVLYNIGSVYHPVYNSAMFLTGTSVTFSLVPEPATILLLMFVGLVMRMNRH